MTEDQLRKWAIAHEEAGSAVAMAVLSLFEKLDAYRRAAEGKALVLDRAPEMITMSQAQDPNSFSPSGMTDIYSFSPSGMTDIYSLDEKGIFRKNGEVIETGTALREIEGYRTRLLKEQGKQKLAMWDDVADNIPMSPILEPDKVTVGKRVFDGSTGLREDKRAGHIEAAPPGMKQ